MKGNLIFTWRNFYFINKWIHNIVSYLINSLLLWLFILLKLNLHIFLDHYFIFVFSLLNFIISYQKILLFI